MNPAPSAEELAAAAPIGTDPAANPAEDQGDDAGTHKLGPELAAAVFAEGLTGYAVPRHPVMVEFIRTWPTAPAEAAYMHTRARVDDMAPPWAELPAGLQFVIRAYVKAQRLADRLLAEFKAAVEAECQAETAKAPPPKLADTIFEKGEADTGIDEDLRPSPTLVVTPPTAAEPEQLDLEAAIAASDQAAA